MAQDIRALYFLDGKMDAGKAYNHWQQSNELKAIENVERQYGDDVPLTIDIAKPF